MTTANELIRMLQREIYKVSTGDIPIIMNGSNFIISDVRLVEHYGKYCIEIIEATTR